MRPNHTRDVITAVPPSRARPGRGFRLLVFLGVALAALVAIEFSLLQRRDHVTPATAELPAVSPRPDRDYPRVSAAERTPAPAIERALDQTRSAEDVDPNYLPGGLPNPNVTPEQAAKVQANQTLDELRKSGRGGGDLSAPALKTIETWKQVAGPGVDFEDFRCFAGGCTTTSRHKDAVSAQSVGDAITRSESFLSWPGTKYRSGPLTTSSGQIEFVWILFRSTSTPTLEPKERP